MNLKTKVGGLACILAFALAAEGLAQTVDPSAMRTWTSRTGSTIEATFAKAQYGIVHLRKADGSITTISLARLSPEDQQLARTFAAATKPKLSAASKPEPQLEEAPEAIHELFGNKLKRANKKTASVDELTGKKIGVYFSAHWCPPCRAFTPKLVDFYNVLKKEEKSFEIVFVSLDRNRKAMYHYMKDTDMPWLALPHGDKRQKKLSSKYNVRGIPKLVILNKGGELITEDGRGDVTAHGVAAYNKW